MSHIVIVGGGSALAQPLIHHWQAHHITAVCRNTQPDPTLVRHLASTLRVVSDITQVKGKVDVLVTMTGSVKNSMLEDMPVDDWSKVVDDVLSSVFVNLKYSLPSMNNPSNVVVVGSIVGSMGGYGCANYAAAKAGLVGLVRSAANEWMSKGVMVNLLQLGYCDIGMGAALDPKIKEKILSTIPLRRFATSDDVVQAVDFLARTRYATGTVLTLAGGLR